MTARTTSRRLRNFWHPKRVLDNCDQGYAGNSMGMGGLCRAELILRMLIGIGGNRASLVNRDVPAAPELEMFRSTMTAPYSTLQSRGAKLRRDKIACHDIWRAHSVVHRFRNRVPRIPNHSRWFTRFIVPYPVHYIHLGATDKNDFRARPSRCLS